MKALSADKNCIGKLISKILKLCFETKKRNLREFIKLAYRKLPLVGAALMQLRKGILEGLINGGAYIRGGLYPRGLMTGIEKMVRKEP